MESEPEQEDSKSGKSDTVNFSNWKTLGFLTLKLVFRIRVGSAFNGFLDPDPNCKCGSGSRRGKIAQKKRKIKSENQKKFKN
jgi:hypothetical protein